MNRLALSLPLLFVLVGCKPSCWSSDPEQCRAERQQDHTQAVEPRDPPPAGEQFDEGPVLARLPVTQLSPVRFVF